METANSIFRSRLYTKRNQRLTRTWEVNRIRRAMAAADAAIGSAEAEGDADTARTYTAIMDNLQAELEKAQAALDKALAPISADEAAAAWEEMGTSLKNDLLNRLKVYEEKREELADALRQILDDYSNYRAERRLYLYACKDRATPADQHREQLRGRFPAFLLDAESIRADLEFFGYTGDLLPEDIDCYLEYLREEYGK